YVPLLYTITAYFAVFVSSQTRTIVGVIAGAEYADAVPATMLMALYPIHQTYGQLSGSVFYATDQTRLYRNIGITAMAVGLFATWFALAPRDWMGLDAGSLGLATKMVAMQVISVNVQLWFNTRYLGLSVRWFLRHQLVVVVVFFLIARAASFLAGVFVEPGIVHLGFSGVLYTLAVGVTGWTWPQLAGLQVSDRTLLRKELAARWRGRSGTRN
ncbi:MAG: lipopolysaccharide biosynthesis protein, partial [Acidobacteria bacterium]|nr:lipopolysaccharide biosynthesis protein [Acidobacteriota bacterium]